MAQRVFSLDAKLHFEQGKINGVEKSHYRMLTILIASNSGKFKELIDILDIDNNPTKDSNDLIRAIHINPFDAGFVRKVIPAFRHPWPQ
jgi:hypothetical protein